MSATPPSATTQPPVREPALELIADYPCETGEGPLWHPEEACLYWVDIPPGHLYRYDPARDRHERVFEADRSIGGFTIQENGDLLLFMAAGRVMTWNRNGTDIVIPQVDRDLETRFNDVSAGPQGQVFCGTMATSRTGPADGHLYRLAPNGTLDIKLTGIGTSNGMAWTPDRSRFLHTDTRTRCITSYAWNDATGDFDPATGTLVYQAPEEVDYGRPDGMTIDADGDLWIAHWDGFSVVHTDPSGRVKEILALPVRKVSSVTIAGPDMNDMYITTAGGNDRGFNGADAGNLFRIPGIARGQPEFQSRIGLG